MYNDTTAPVAPTATATDVTDTTAKISWVPAEADKDIVEYQLMNGDKEIATFDATETSFTVADLKAATEYTLSVYALDEAGNKSDAGNVTFTTKATEEHTHTWGEWTVTKKPTCTTPGEESRTCECGETETREIKATGHTWGDWKTTKEPTSEAEGLKERVCKSCDAHETQTIAKLTSKPVTPTTPDKDKDKDNSKDKPVKTGDADMAGATTAACILSGIAAVAVFKKRKTV